MSVACWGLCGTDGCRRLDHCTFCWLVGCAGGHGSRPSGVALGETSVAVRVPGRDVEILWTDIVAVDALASSRGAGRRSR